jgi:hypothetical protein
MLREDFMPDYGLTLLILGPRLLDRVLRVSVHQDNRHRPHRGLELGVD